MALTIEVRFLLGSFAASDGHDGTPPEWPPAPARLFSGLVAACEGDHAEALRWLESQPAPVIYACEAGPAVSHPQWLVTNALEAAGGSARHPGRKAIQRSRSRAHLRDPLVVYEWQAAEPSKHDLEALDDAARRLHYLGRPISPVAARVLAEAHSPLPDVQSWIPGERGFASPRLRVPFSGYLDALESAFDSGVHVDPPVYENYRRADDEATARMVEREVASPWRHLLVLPLASSAWIPGERTLEVTAALRSALLDLISNDVSPVVSGHGKAAPHCAYLALPDVGHEHADGHLLGLALALPHDPEGIRQIRRALDADDTGRYRIALRNVRGFGELRFEQPVDGTAGVRWGARRERWTGPAQRWRTVLPAILDKAPSRRVSEAEAVLETVANIGLRGVLVGLEAQRSPFVRGDVALRSDRTRRRREDRIRPYRHLRLEFDQPVRGPLLVGAMRHFGLGLCVPDEH